MKILNRKFYNRNTLKVAQELLGCFLVRKYRGKIWRAMITETEAYHGERDLASHASRGRTPRTEVMYDEPGRAYVYMIYGMYFCLNIVTEKKDFPAAVLIRGAKIISSSPARGEELEEGWELDGPGKLCRFLKIDKRLNKWDITKGEKLWIARPEGARSRSGQKKPKPSGFAGSGAARKIQKSKRIGIDYAKHCKEYLWRFQLKMK